MTIPSSSLSPAERANATLAVNALRALSFHGVEKANSGHPGMPMGGADMAYVLWTKFIRFDPSDPDWADRDRFVLSAGHGSMLLYSMLHLCGFDVTVDDLKSFRQWGSRTPGHPEWGHLPGVETTTGPLGQGVANAVGMALAEAMLAARFNKKGANLVDHYTYGICSDGDLMEGVSAEAASIAGHLGLGKLILLYDDNGISIDGPTTLSFAGEDVAKRFDAYGWHTAHVDGHNHDEIEAAIVAAQAQTTKPSLICCRTTIGFGSPNKHNTSEVHGSPLGAEEIELTRKALGWTAPPFEVPDAARAPYAAAAERGKAAHAEWNKRLDGSDGATVAEYREFVSLRMQANLEASLPTFEPGKALATRQASGKTLDAIAPKLPWLVGGSADLTPSNNTKFKGAVDVENGQFEGRYLRYGVREHGMCSLNNGMALHGGLVPFGATFLVFSDYCRPAIRLAALMGIQNIFVFTHDSVFLGEDGPTHQPVEHLEALRAIPNLNVVRPGDAEETAWSWLLAVRSKKSPTLLALTRQGLPVYDRAAKGYAPASETLRGGYVMRDPKSGKLDVVIIATGSELHLAIAASESLEAEGIGARVVSMPCEKVFEEQGAEYVAKTLPAGVPRLAVEAGCTRGWRRWVGLEGDVVGLDRYGASAPAGVLAKQFGFTAENVAARAKALARK